MPITTYHASTTAVWADALFVSVLQRSDQPGAGQVRQAIAGTTFTQSEHDQLAAFYTEGDEPE
jgi:hypothetical protein